MAAWLYQAVRIRVFASEKPFKVGEKEFAPLKGASIDNVDGTASIFIFSRTPLLSLGADWLWTYKQYLSPQGGGGDGESAWEKIQKLGEEGWELVNVIKTQELVKDEKGFELLWIFKKPKKK